MGDTVGIALLPIRRYLLAMLVTLLLAIVEIAFFNYYVSVVKDEKFGADF